MFDLSLFSKKLDRLLFVDVFSQHRTQRTTMHLLIPFQLFLKVVGQVRWWEGQSSHKMSETADSFMKCLSAKSCQKAWSVEVSLVEVGYPSNS